RLRVTVEGRHRDHRAEDLLVKGGHPRAYPGQHGGRIEALGAAAAEQLPGPWPAASSVILARYSSARSSCTRCRPTAMQIWPWCTNEPQAPLFTAASRSASSSTM